MFPKPKAALTPNTYAYESEPLVKPTGFREYDARWLLNKEINLMGLQALGMGLGTPVQPLSLCEAVTIATQGTSRSNCAKYAIGVIASPMSCTLQPAASRPEISAVFTDAE